jgi:hypothetical protein
MWKDLDNEENCGTRRRVIFILHLNYKSNQTKDDEMGWTCSVHGKCDNFIHNFASNIWKKGPWLQEAQ